MKNKKLISFSTLCENCLFNGVELKTKRNICSNIHSKDAETTEKSCPIWNELDEMTPELFNEIVDCE